jgi:hypothetical protein
MRHGESFGATMIGQMKDGIERHPLGIEIIAHFIDPYAQFTLSKAILVFDDSIPPRIILKSQTYESFPWQSTNCMKGITV